MKKLLVILALIVTTLSPSLALSGGANAAAIFKNCGNNSAAGSPNVCNSVDAQGANDGTNNPIVKIIKAAISILSYIIGAAAVIGILVSGLRMITAGGDSSAVASARTGLIYSLIGIAVTVLAQALVHFVLNRVK